MHRRVAFTGPGRTGRNLAPLTFVRFEAYRRIHFKPLIGVASLALSSSKRRDRYACGHVVIGAGLVGTARIRRGCCGSGGYSRIRSALIRLIRVDSSLLLDAIAV